MKTATIPAVRVEPEFRAELEAMLGDGESLSQFVEGALRATVARRRAQTEFVSRGLASIAETKAKGNGIPADVVSAKREARLGEAVAAEAGVGGARG